MKKCDPCDKNAEIMTVLGPVSPDSLGPTYMHEHIMHDNSFSRNDPMKKYDEEDVAIWEMTDVLRAGGKTVVDCTCRGLSPQPAALKRIAEASGINIIASTGFYREMVYPECVARESADQLACRMIDEVRYGLEGTEVRPGMLAEFASHDPEDLPLSENVEKVFRAAARTHVETGLPITTHCWLGVGADWEISVFKEEGVRPDKIVIAHVGADVPDMERVRSILDEGVNIGIDAIGYGVRDIKSGYGDREKALLVKQVADWGCLSQVTISLDMTRKYHLKKYGGRGFAHLLDGFVPLLREVGLSDKQVNQLLIDNPKRILTPVNRCKSVENDV